MSMFRVICVLVLFFHWSYEDFEDSPYCALRFRRLCQGKGTHVGCMFPSLEPGDSCYNMTIIKFDSEMKHFITHYLNRRRQRIAMGAEKVRGGTNIPKPQVMLQVAWDRELAHLAQRLANQCEFVHDDCRATVRYPFAGQTVGEVKWRRSTESDSQSALRAIRRIFDAWWGEKRRVQPKHLITPFRITNKGKAWGHFTQLAVWNLCAVGCGAVRHVAKYPRLLLVCDFSHTNMLGQKTINPGPLAKCPKHMARRTRSPYPLLCAPVHEENSRYSGKSEARDLYQETYYVEDEYDEPIEEYNIEEEEAADAPRKSIDKYDNEPAETMTRQKIHSTKTQKKYSTSRKTRHRKIDEDTSRLDKENVKSYIMGMRQTTTVPERVSLKYVSSPTDTPEEIYLRRRITRPTLPQRIATDSKVVEDSRQFSINQKIIDEESENNGEELRKANRLEWRPSHRWATNRNRPIRPGAKALLTNSQGALEEQTQKAIKDVVGSLKMDQEDIEQLFKDTGFKLNWREQTPIRPQ